MVILGLNSPERNIDIFLKPLIEELKQLWRVAVNIYYVSRRWNFQMKAIFLWIISDFPRYGMLFGWSTHRRLSCPYCMECTKIFILKNVGKASFLTTTVSFYPLIINIGDNGMLFIMVELREICPLLDYLMKKYWIEYVCFQISHLVYNMSRKAI